MLKEQITERGGECPLRTCQCDSGPLKDAFVRTQTRSGSRDGRCHRLRLLTPATSAPLNKEAGVFFGLHAALSSVLGFCIYPLYYIGLGGTWGLGFPFLKLRQAGVNPS